MKKREGALSQKSTASEQKEFNIEGEWDKSLEEGHSRVFMLDEGRLKPFPRNEYTVSALYEVAESFAVECRLVKPEEPGNVLYEGKKPSKKTVPVIVNRDGESLVLDSWGDLEAEPSQLADAREVLGVVSVKQVFVLKRKEL